MTVKPNNNEIFQTHRLASPYNIQANLSEFFTELSKTSLRNMLKNEFMKLIVSGTPLEWTKTGTLSLSYVPATQSADGSFNPNAKLTQEITSNLRPNKVYTAIAILQATDGDIKFSVTADNANQIFNYDDNSEVDSASVTALAASGLQKVVIQFKTNATEVSGSVYFNIENINLGSARTVKLRYLSVYDGLVEFEEIGPNDVYHSDYSTLATSALSAGFAEEAAHAVSADLATWAISANLAENAQHADLASHSDTSSVAASAGVAANAENADTLDGYHYDDIIAAIPSVIEYDGTAYYDNRFGYLGVALKVVVDGTTRYFPSSTTAGGTCHSNCHGNCHSWDMCHIFTTDED